MTTNVSELSDATVLSLDETAVPLRSFWANGTAVLVFLRHYG